MLPRKRRQNEVALESAESLDTIRKRLQTGAGDVELTTMSKRQRAVQQLGANLELASAHVIDLF